MTQSNDRTDWTSGIFALTPAESKRLIGRAVAALPEVRRAFTRGRIVIAAGTSAAYCADEILGTNISKERFVSGLVCNGLLAANVDPDRLFPICIVDGQVVDRRVSQVLLEFTADDVYVKGANAVDPQRNVGMLCASDTAGTIGASIGILAARGSHFIVPIGLEKLVASVPAAAGKTGIHRLKYALGIYVGFLPIVGATVITEIEAVRVLCDVQATQIAGGGVGGSEGAVVLAVEGPDENVAACIELVTSIKGEPPVPANVEKVQSSGRYGIAATSYL